MTVRWSSVLAQVSVDPDTARDTADDVLSQRPYLDAARPPSLQERAFDWIVDQVGELLNALSNAGGRGFTAYLVIGFFVVVAALLIWKLVRSWSPLPKAATLPDPEVIITSGRSPREWLADAETAEADQRWTDAIRLRHRALVAELVDQQVLGAEPGQTAGTISRVVALHSPDANQPMASATDMFKEAWYGNVPMGPDDLGQFRTRVDQVESAVSATVARQKSSNPVDVVAPA